MSKNEIRIFKKTLLSHSKSGDLAILEWGSGGSTVYFSKFLEDRKIRYSWLSMEYNHQWFEKVKSNLHGNTNVTLKLFDVGNLELKQRHTNMDDYVDYPKTLNKKFDVIFVDGRKRRRCVLLAKQLLKDDGVVFLHDAQRKYYQCVFREFETSYFISPELWIGSNEKVPFPVYTINKIINTWNRFLFFCAIKPSRFVRNHSLSKYKSVRETLSLVKGLPSKVKVLGMIVFFALRKKGISLGNYSCTLVLVSGQTISLLTMEVADSTVLLNVLKNQKNNSNLTYA